MRVGLLTASSSRQAGGIFWAMRSLVGHLRDEGCPVQVFTGRDSHSEEDRGSWGQVPLQVFETVGFDAFGYAPGLGAKLLCEPLDLLHTHGIWMYPSVAARIWGRRTGKPWLVSPHGMLDRWALQNARWKKRVAGLLYENSHLRGAACLHALCDAEAEALRAYGLTNPIATIPNGVELPEQPKEPAAPEWVECLPDGARVLLFLGRLHSKKGLANLLHAWALELSAADEPWVLVVAGWDQDGYRGELEGLVESLGIARTVRFVGPQFGTGKSASFFRADAFVLPSFSEGLPMAVLEAWAHRLPVLMTNQCNLPEGFAAGAAVPIEPGVEAICRGLRTLIRMNQGERERMGAQGRKLVEDRFTWRNVAAEMRAVYAWVLGMEPKPDCVKIE